MEYIVLNIIDKYPSLLAKEMVLERHLTARENMDLRDALTVVKMQLNAIESWFVLLSVEERVVFRQVLLGNHDAGDANRIAATRWLERIVRAGQSPWKLKESAIRKISDSSGAHRKLMDAIFEDI